MMRGRQQADRCCEGVEDRVGSVKYRSDFVMLVNEFNKESVRKV